ncbi:MAG: AAA family ATPase [Firmicutes bacterium]|nr:AAA family ATPase [Bacillota bacterium]
MRPLAGKTFLLRKPSCTGVFRGSPRLDAAKQARDLVEQFGLEHTGRRALAFYSGGERRLAGGLSAFMGDLPVLILDEPTNDLDPMNRRRLWDVLRFCARNTGRSTGTAVYSHRVGVRKTRIWSRH